jgi:hypothetical protein
MSQTNYSFKQQAAVPGGLCDTAPHSIVTRANEEAALDAMKFGIGVVKGSNPGRDVELPTSSSTVNEFEGVVVTGVKQMDFNGNVVFGKGDTLGILQWGKVWVKLAGDLTVNYGDQLYLINIGADAGLFSNEEDNGFAVNGKFIGGVESGDIAPVELYSNQNPAIVTALEDHETRISALENA